MGDTWDDEDYEPATAFRPAALQDKWEGEDEEDDVKDSWDAEDEEGEKPETNSVGQQGTASKTKKRRKLDEIIAEKEAKKAEEFKRRQEELKAQQEEEPEKDALQRKMEELRMQEEADLELAKEAFGDSSTISSPSHAAITGNLESKEDFETFRKAIADRLSPTAVHLSPHFIPFVEDVLRDVVAVISDMDDLKRVSGTLSALYNEKLKASKATKSKKKQPKGGAGRISVKGVRQEDMQDYSAFGGADDYDDFM